MAQASLALRCSLAIAAQSNLAGQELLAFGTGTYRVALHPAAHVYQHLHPNHMED